MSNKTVANDLYVNDFIEDISDTIQRSDSKKLLQIFARVTSEQPIMWGASIIGFGTVRLQYASGRRVDWLRIGFSPRKGKISLYVTFDAQKLTQQFPDLGSYSIGKGCIYIKKLTDVDLGELEKLIKKAWQTGYEQPKRSDGKEQ